MLHKLFQKLCGKEKDSNSHNLDLEIVTPGNPAHSHSFARMPWDRERFGSSFCNPDTDHGELLSFPLATYKSLFSCRCGAEGVESVRALI